MDVSKWHSIMMTIGLSYCLYYRSVECDDEKWGEIQIKSLINVNKTTLPNDDAE